MPIYEYRCRDCGERFEDLVNTSTKDEDVVCPKCGAKNATRELSAFAAGGSSGSSGADSIPSGACSVGGG